MIFKPPHCETCPRVLLARGEQPAKLDELLVAIHVQSSSTAAAVRHPKLVDIGLVNNDHGAETPVILLDPRLSAAIPCNARTRPAIPSPALVVRLVILILYA